MKRKKSLIAIMIPTLVTILLSISFLSYWTIPFHVFRKTSSNVSFSRQDNEISVSGNDVKILQLTDLHINGKLDMPRTYSTIKKLIHKTEPDLIVFTGDIFSGSKRLSKKTVDKFFSFMEDVNLPWAAVLGNHDGETPYTLSELSQKFESAGNSLYKTGDLSNLYGNYAYNVKFEDNQMFQLIFMDSRQLGFTEESVEFYRQTVESTKEINNGTALQNFTFFHIPVAEMSLAVKAYEENASIGEGEINEALCLQETRVGFFDQVLQLNKTKAMIWGHDHINNAKILYKGVRMCYGAKTGTSSYNYRRIKGGTLYSLKSDGSFAVKDVLL